MNPRWISVGIIAGAAVAATVAVQLSLSKTSSVLESASAGTIQRRQLARLVSNKRTGPVAVLTPVRSRSPFG